MDIKNKYTTLEVLKAVVDEIVTSTSETYAMKDDIPLISGTSDDDINWKSITINGETKLIPQTSGSGTTNGITKSEADLLYAEINHTHDNYATKDDLGNTSAISATKDSKGNLISLTINDEVYLVPAKNPSSINPTDGITREDADLLYAEINHTHDNYATKDEIPDVSDLAIKSELIWDNDEDIGLEGKLHKYTDGKITINSIEKEYKFIEIYYSELGTSRIQYFKIDTYPLLKEHIEGNKNVGMFYILKVDTSPLFNIEQCTVAFDKVDEDNYTLTVQTKAKDPTESKIKIERIYGGR